MTNHKEIQYHYNESKTNAMSQYKKKYGDKTYRTYKTYEQTKKWYEQMSPMQTASLITLTDIAVVTP